MVRYKVFVFLLGVLGALLLWPCAWAQQADPTQYAKEDAKPEFNHLLGTVPDPEGESERSLGCFYYRGRYSHLPMFENNNYTFPGSREVSDVYWKEFTGFFSGPDTDLHSKR